EPSRILPGVCANVSQIDLPLPFSFHAPSIWYAEVAVPQKKPVGNSRGATCTAWWEDVLDTIHLRRKGWRLLRNLAEGLSCGDATWRQYGPPGGVGCKVRAAVVPRRAGSVG